MAAITN